MRLSADPISLLFQRLTSFVYLSPRIHFHPNLSCRILTFVFTRAILSCSVLENELSHRSQINFFQLFIHSPIHVFIHSFFYSFIHSFIQPFNFNSSNSDHFCETNDIVHTERSPLWPPEFDRPGYENRHVKCNELVLIKDQDLTPPNIDRFIVREDDYYDDEIQSNKKLFAPDHPKNCQDYR